MTLREVRIKAAKLKACRADADVKEAELKYAIAEFLAPGEAIVFAQKTGVTPQYLSDIRNGKRRISDEFMEKVASI